MRFKKDQPKEGDPNVTLGIAQILARGNSNSDGSKHFFAPHADPVYRTPTGWSDSGGSTIQAPEKKLTLFAFHLAILEKSASCLGTLAFVWATVVCLGGFASTLETEDFLFVTLILLVESTRIFGRSHELEWQHQATWTMGGAERSSFGVLQSISRFFVGVLRAIVKPLSVFQSNREGRSSEGQVIECATHWTWRSPDVLLLPYSGWVFVSKNISRVLSWLQLLSAFACVTLSSMRLIQQDYGSAEHSRNRSPALNLFYGLALAEALVFLMEKAYWTWMISYCNLLENVSRECELGATGMVSVRRFFYDTFSKCINGSVFDGLKMDLVNFANELLDSEFRDEQLIGAQILRKFVKSNRFAYDTVRKIGTSTWVIERLIEMLNWKNPGEEEIRRCAAEIVSKLAGKRRNVLRVAGIPGAMESLSSLLHTDRSSGTLTCRETSASSIAVGETSYDFTVFNLLGLLILKKLATDHDDCEKIGNARGLLPKIIYLTSASRTLLRNDPVPVSQIKTVKRSLQVVKMLVSTTGNTGKMLRREISDIVFMVSNIREILQNGESHMVLQKLGIEILKSLALDENAKEKIGSTGGIVKLLLSIFFKPGITRDENSVSNEAGETLAMLALKSKRNCDRILKESEVLEQLMRVLTDPVLQVNASRILRNLCAYGRIECSDRLRGITTAMPTVLKAIMEAKDKLLEVSIGLTTQICKFMGPSKIAEVLKQASIEEIDLVEKLAQILKEYSYPEIRVPRIRRFVIEQAIWMMKSNRNSIQLFKKFEMESLLESVAETTSELECFHIFSGSVGLIRHSKTSSSLVEAALDLMVAEE